MSKDSEMSPAVRAVIANHEKRIMDSPPPHSDHHQGYSKTHKFIPVIAIVLTTTIIVSVVYWLINYQTEIDKITNTNDCDELSDMRWKYYRSGEEVELDYALDRMEFLGC